MKNSQNKWRMFIPIGLAVICLIVVCLMLILPKITYNQLDGKVDNSSKIVESSTVKSSTIEDSSIVQSSDDTTSMANSSTVEAQPTNSSSEENISSKPAEESSSIGPDESSESESGANDSSKPVMPDDIDKEKIFHKFQVNMIEENIIDYKDFIFDYFDGKVYNSGEIIDCKAEIKKLGVNPSDYYNIFSTIYSAWNFCTYPRMLSEENAKFDSTTMKYGLSDDKDLILKFPDNEKLTLRIYCDDERAYFVLLKD